MDSCAELNSCRSNDHIESTIVDVEAFAKHKVSCFGVVPNLILEPGTHLIGISVLGMPGGRLSPRPMYSCSVAATRD
ncbi:hypothetical protein N7528_001005 [Penicillium herquei]|nr:hypothetical protein N7528_001005 [Penicillium herquei]